MAFSLDVGGVGDRAAAFPLESPSVSGEGPSIDPSAVVREAQPGFDD